MYGVQAPAGITSVGPGRGPSTFLRRTRAGSFGPSDITGLRLKLAGDGVLWQDSARTTPATADGDPVGAWDDASGLGFNFTQVTAGKRPLLKTAVINGKPVVRADGINDNLVSTSLSAASGSLTLYAVLATSGGEGGLMPVLDSGTGRLLVEPCLVGWYDGAFHDVGTTTSAWQVLSWVLTSGGNGEVFRNGVSLGTAAYSTVGVGGTSAVFSTFDSASEFLPADLAELLLYEGAHGSTDRASVETYLNGRYAIY